MKTLTSPSPAKINLALRVTGLAAHGFHEIQSLVAQIDLCDTLTITERLGGHLSLDCDDPRIPSDDSNLVLRAAKALAGATGVKRGAHIALAKRIPAGAGLGGGSSNAATTLKLLNELWELRLTPHELAHIGATVGSDVPLFCHGALSIISGRGELVEELDKRCAPWAALVLPELHCSTPAVYAAWDRLATHATRPDLEQVLAALPAASSAMEVLFNDLEEPAFEVVPQLRGLALRVAEAGGATVRLTGSGAALFRLFDGKDGAESFTTRITERLGVRTEVVRLLTG